MKIKYKNNDDRCAKCKHILLTQWRFCPICGTKKIVIESKFNIEN